MAWGAKWKFGSDVRPAINGKYADCKKKSGLFSSRWIGSMKSCGFLTLFPLGILIRRLRGERPFDALRTFFFPVVFWPPSNV